MGKRWQNFRAKIARYKPLERMRTMVEIAAEGGALIMDLRDKPTKGDWIGLGLRSLSLATKVKDEITAISPPQAFEAFSEDKDEKGDCRWIATQDEFKALFLKHARDNQNIPGFGNPKDATSTYATVGWIGEEQVGWTYQTGKLLEPEYGPFILKARKDATFQALGDSLWKSYRSNHCLFQDGKVIEDPFDAEGFLVTKQVRGMETRIRAFDRERIPRSILMQGPPGTGKSYAVRYLTQILNMRSLRVDIVSLTKSSSEISLLESLLKVLRPDVLILDDLDRVSHARILHFLELAAKFCRVIFATANLVHEMTGALLRPGRFDEIVEVKKLDPEVLRKMLNGDEIMAHRMRNLPIAYVVEYLKRVQALGKEAANVEVEELITRARHIGEEYEDDGGEPIAKKVAPRSSGGNWVFTFPSLIEPGPVTESIWGNQATDSAEEEGLEDEDEDEDEEE